MKKLGLALGCGGSRGIAHIGFLQALDEEGITPYCISGISMGSVVGALYCAGIAPQKMLELALSITNSDLLDFSLRSSLKKSLMRSEKIREVLSQCFGDITFEQLKIPFSCVGADIKTGNEVHFLGGKVCDAVLASTAIPLVFQPVEIDGMTVADGGLIHRLPLPHVKQLGADVVVAVDVIGELRQNDNIKSIVAYFFRMLEIFDDTITACRLEKYPPDLLVMPELKDMNQFKIKDIEFAYDRGYIAGKKNIENIKQLLDG